MKTSTIKFKLFAISGLACGILITIGILILSCFRQINQLQILGDQVKSIEVKMLQLRKNEKDFLLRDVINPDFFKSGTSKYIENFDKILLQTYETLSLLEQDAYVKKFNLIKEVELLHTLFNTYHEKMTAIKDAVNRKGFVETGVIGELRNAASVIESHITEMNKPELEIHLLKLRKHEKDYMLRKNEEYINKFNDEILWFGNISERLKNELATDLQTYKSKFEGVVSIDKEIGLTEQEGIMGELRAAIHQVEPAVNDLSARISESNESAMNSAIYQMIILIGIALVVLFITITLIIRSINQSLESAQFAVKEISNGNLTVELGKIRKDEIGALLEDLQKMTVQLRKIMSDITHGASNIASASVQLSSTAQQVSQGATEQASSTEEVSSSMEEMVSNIQQNADNARQTELISQKMIKSVEKVNSAADESLHAIQQISSKIGIVSDIAFQTNILALNAAVEAARAGEHGKGFAVVAAEVRKLAERSKTAAEEIIQLSEKSVSVTGITKKLMDELRPEVERTSTLIQEINSSSLEQNSGADQINNAIQQLNQVTQENAAASEEMATTAEEMTSQAEALTDAISYFNIGNSSPETLKTKPSIRVYKKATQRTDAEIVQTI